MSLVSGSTPSLAITACTCALSPTAQLHQPRSITHQLACLTHGWWCDPRLGEATETQQVREVAGVAFVVLHPSLPPVVARRVRQMHREPGVTEEIDRPVPAIRRFDHHLRALARRADDLEQPQRIVVDPFAEQLVALRVHRVDHRPATMQIDPDVTSIHRGLPSSTRNWFVVKPRVSTTRTSRGAEAPLLHRISYAPLAVATSRATSMPSCATRSALSQYSRQPETSPPSTSMTPEMCNVIGFHAPRPRSGQPRWRHCGTGEISG